MILWGKKRLYCTVTQVIKNWFCTHAGKFLTFFNVQYVLREIQLCKDFWRWRSCVATRQGVFLCWAAVGKLVVISVYLLEILLAACIVLRERQTVKTIRCHVFYWNATTVLFALLGHRLVCWTKTNLSVCYGVGLILGVELLSTENF